MIKEITHKTAESFSKAIGLSIETIRAHNITLWAGEPEAVHKLELPGTWAPNVGAAVTWREINYVPSLRIYPLLETEYGDYYITELGRILYFRDVEGLWFTADEPIGVVLT